MFLAKQLKLYWLDRHYATKSGIYLSECYSFGKTDYIKAQEKRHVLVHRFFASDADKEQIINSLRITKTDKSSVLTGFSWYLPPEGRTVMRKEWVPIGTALTPSASPVIYKGDLVTKNGKLQIRIPVTY